MFASDLDATTRQQLTRGSRLMRLLRQPQYTPYRVEDQVASIWSGTNGYLDDVDLEDIDRFEAGFLDHLRRNTNVLTEIAETGRLEEDTENTLREAVEEFRKGFMSESGVALGEGEVPEDEEVLDSQEQIVRSKRG